MLANRLQNGSQRARAWALLVTCWSSLAHAEEAVLGQGRDIIEFPSIARVVIVFLVVAALAVLVARLMRRYVPGMGRTMTSGAAMRVVDRTVINPGLKVHLIEVDGERVLLAEHRSGLSLLSLRPKAGSTEETRGNP